MRLIILFLIIVIAGAGAGYYFGYDIGFEKALDFLKQKNADEAHEGATVYENKEFGFSLSYPTGADGYTAIPLAGDDASLYKGGVAFYKQTDWDELQKSDIPREGPPGVTVEVFTNADNVLADEWVKNNPHSNFQLSDKKTERVAYDGVEGARYAYDGLYRAESIVFAYRTNIIMMTVAYFEENDGRVEDFNEMLATLAFEGRVTADLIHVMSIKEGDGIESPLTITGEARGTWYFEASFPIILVDWDGRIIAESHAQAQGDWMTEDFVPFSGTIEFTKPYSDMTNISDFMKRGALILKKDNPSGMPAYENAIEIPIIFK